MSSHCDEFGPLIAAAVDDEITDEQRTRLDQHLQQCPGCRLRLEQEQETALLMEGLELDVLEQDQWVFVEQVLPVKRTTRTLRMSWLFGLGLLLVLSKSMDLALFEGHAMVMRCIVLVMAAMVFLVIRENPFRLASEMELVGRTES